jgi:hypothetical protein
MTSFAYTLTDSRTMLRRIHAGSRLEIALSPQ